MRFTQGRQRRPPSVIIVSLIDVLLVVLIFLMVSTTFRDTPSLKIVLPESTQAEKQGTTPDKVVVTIARTQPHLFLGTLPVTYDRLQTELVNLASRNTNLALVITPDEGAPIGELVRVMDAAKAAKLRSVQWSARKPGSP